MAHASEGRCQADAEGVLLLGLALKGRRPLKLFQAPRCLRKRWSLFTFPGLDVQTLNHSHGPCVQLVSEGTFHAFMFAQNGMDSQPATQSMASILARSLYSLNDLSMCNATFVDFIFHKVIHDESTLIRPGDHIFLPPRIDCEHLHQKALHLGEQAFLLGISNS